MHMSYGSLGGIDDVEVLRESPNLDANLEGNEKLLGPYLTLF